MLLSEPSESEYDLRFMVMGFPVRIAWTFWLGAVVFGHSLCRDVVGGYLSGNPVGELDVVSPGIGPLLILWVLCLFLSVLIHELGHALAFRRCGIHCSIVLYHFGGLAIPSSGFSPGRSAGRITQKEQLFISAAGPALQILSAVVLIMVVKLAGYQVAIFNNMPAGLDRIPWVAEGNLIDSAGLYALVSFYVFPSILWALLNLVPVWPLDGGHIARSLILMNRGTVVHSLWLSIFCAGLLAFYAVQSGNTMMAIFFAMFGFSSYQMLQSSSGWRY